MKRICVALAAVSIACAALPSQTAAKPVPEPYRADEFPVFLQELRRFEIVSIGAFPLAVFYSTFFYDLYRLASKSIEAGALDARYLPWPLKGPDAFPLSREEKGGILIAAASASVVVGALDYIFIKAKARQALRRSTAAPAPEDGTPIAIPAPDEDAAAADAQPAGPPGSASP